MVSSVPPVASNEIRTAILVSSPVSGSRCRAMNRISSSPAPAVVGSTRAGDRLQLGRRDVARRPDVDDDPVGGEALLRRPPRLRAADRVEAGGDGVLGGGQRDQPAVVLAQLGQVAHLRERDQPVVGRVLPGDALEQVDLLVGGRQAGQVELAQPLQLHPLRDVRVQAADQPLLGHPGGRRAEREVVVHHRAAAARDGGGEPADLARQRVRAMTSCSAAAIASESSGWFSQAR